MFPLLAYKRLNSKKLFTYHIFISILLQHWRKKMGSPKLPITIVIPLILLFFTYDSKGASYDTSGSQIKPVDYEKVNLSVYYESLSNSSAVFIVKNLREIFNNDLIDIVNLQLVPWANSHVNQTNNAISCQVLIFLYFE